MKVILTVFFVFIFGQSEITSAFNYKISPDSLSFQEPTNWQPVPQKVKGTLCQFVSPNPSQGFTSNLVVTVVEFTQKEAQNLEKNIIDINIKKQERTFPLYKVLENRNIKISKLNSKLLVAVYAMGNLDIVSYQVFILQDTRVYNFVFTCLKDNYGELEKEFEECVGSVRIEKMEEGNEGMRE